MKRYWCVLLGLLAVSSQVPAVEIIDSGATLGEYPIIRWMDNQRVMFLAASGQFCARDNKPKSYKVPLNRIAVFDLKTRQLNPYGEVGVGGLCYADGNVAYARRRVTDGLCPTDEWSYFRGRVGEEKELPGVRLDTYTCLSESEVRPIPAWLSDAKKLGRRFMELKAEHGWAEVVYPQQHSREFDADRRDGHPIRIFPPDSGQGFVVDKLPAVPIRPIGHYSPFKGAYLLVEQSGYSPITAGVFHSWWLYPDGRIEIALEYDRKIRKGGVALE